MVYWPDVFAPSKKDVSGSEYIIRTRMMQGVFWRIGWPKPPEKPHLPTICRLLRFRLRLCHSPASRRIASAMSRVSKRTLSTGQDSSGMCAWAGSPSGSTPKATAFSNERA